MGKLFSRRRLRADRPGSARLTRGRLLAGLSAAVASGRQLGAAAARDPVYRGHLVVIPAGGTAHALLGYGAVEVSTSGCKPKMAAQLKVYPPNSVKAINTFFALPACTIGGGHLYLRVAVIQPGTRI